MPARPSPTDPESRLATALRTASCGELTAANVGQHVVLTGWVARRRDYGKLIFIDLRDRYGLTQVVFDPERSAEAAAAHAVASEARLEYVLRVEGTVQRRLPGKENPQLATGEIEVEAQSAAVLNPARTTPFPIADHVSADEALRLRYRYLDLRRDSMRERIVLRHRVVKLIRDFMDAREFVEVETPILTKSTPEGARDYLVPSRLYPGDFYALPQAPQQFKQLLMVAGLDRYFQIARCFRDEDLRADRQPEFTQLDVEMSFVSEADVMGLIEQLLIELIEATTDKRIQQRPFPHLTFAESLEKYGTDHPDLRFDLPLTELGDLARLGSFKVFHDALDRGGIVKGLRVPGLASATRKELDELTEFAKQHGAKGLVTLVLQSEGPKSPLTRFMSEEELARLIAHLGGETGDLLLFVADDAAVANDVLFRLRNRMGERLELIDPNVMALAALSRDAQPIFRDAAGRGGAAGNRPVACDGAAVRHHLQRLRDRWRQYSDQRGRPPAPRLPATRPLRRADRGAVRPHARSLRVWRAAARRHRARHRSPGHVAGGWRDDPRRHGVPEDAKWARRADARALSRLRRPACGPASAGRAGGNTLIRRGGRCIVVMS